MFFHEFKCSIYTGVLDQDTLNLMSTPRCGMKDKLALTSNSNQNNRVKRYIAEGEYNFLPLKIF